MGLQLMMEMRLEWWTELWLMVEMKPKPWMVLQPVMETRLKQMMDLRQAQREEHRNEDHEP